MDNWLGAQTNLVAFKGDDFIAVYLISVPVNFELHVISKGVIT